MRWAYITKMIRAIYERNNGEADKIIYCERAKRARNFFLVYWNDLKIEN